MSLTFFFFFCFATKLKKLLVISSLHVCKVSFHWQQVFSSSSDTTLSWWIAFWRNVEGKEEKKVYTLSKFVIEIK